MPTLTQRPRPLGGALVERIIIPVEGAARELLAQQWAVEMGVALGATVRAVHLHADAEPPPEDIFDHLRQQCQHHGVPFESIVVPGATEAEDLVTELDPTDLVVIGTQHLGNGYQVGSFTEALIRQAPCPVQVIRLN